MARGKSLLTGRPENHRSSDGISIIGLSVGQGRVALLGAL
jgi:hypothetical protein